MDLLFPLLSSIICFFFLLHGVDLYRRRRLPPGPIGLPIIGNLLDLGPKPHESLAKFAQKYGPLITVQLGTVNLVVASTREAARDILLRHDEACSGRPVPHAVAALKHHDMAVLWIPPKKQPYESEDIREFKMAVETAIEVQGVFNIADTFPVKRFDPQNVWRRAKAAFMWLEDKVQGSVNERLKHRDSKLPRFDDVLDSMLDYCHDHDADFNVEHIKTLIVDVLVAGTDTIANATTWVLSELLLNPHMFSRVREEVSQIVGEDGKIEEAKTLDLPYLHAVIKETMRLHAGSPLLAPHITQTEVKIGNYVLPKNTQIFVDVWAMSRDPRYWENPTVFMPERFLKNKLEFKGQHFEFIPFGSGRRRCPGMPLAERMLSLIVASFVYHFDWELPHTKEEMDMNDLYGLTILKATPLVATPDQVTR
ncbi:hypothetical protein L1987_17698 [Smallanthus sonchifolius]|uniref:Uncharacterized protein n=1 Tax=Smallanthus sonchifolius TaxID=185202 RepID=A0ACB9IY88_9ASTR|nr:hypothetical protein L1987_17698 [Smallanthus sonchifolius]